MKIIRPYKDIPVIGFSEGVTNTNLGPIYDLYFVNQTGIRDHEIRDAHIPIGRIGANFALPGNPLYYATPIMYSPFTNTAGRFRTRREAAIFLYGIYVATQPWLAEMKRNPQPSNIGMRHMGL